LKLLRRNKTKIAETKEKYGLVLPLQNRVSGLAFLIQVLKKIRPTTPDNAEDAIVKFKAFLYQLNTDRSLLFSMRKALLSQFNNAKITTALTENGIVSSRGFYMELFSKIKHKILPALLEPNNFLYVINKVFYRKKDWIWVEKLPNELWADFFNLLGVQINVTHPKIITQLHNSLQILSYRVAALGIEKEITERFTDADHAIHPFIEQNRLTNAYIQKVVTEGYNFTGKAMHIAAIEEALYNCLQSVTWIKEQRLTNGTSLAQTYLLTRIEQQIQRMFIVYDVVDEDSAFNTDRFVDYFKTIVTNEKRKNSLKEFLSENTGFLAYQIAEHGGKTGDNYITTTKKEYWQMFLSAAGGGFIISFIGLLKNIIAKLSLPPFWKGFLYSSNYATGFILIQETGCTLATKQPAYTANTIASALDEKHGDFDMRNLVIIIAKVCRTQIASFAANLLVVFPMAYLLAMLFFSTTGFYLIANDAGEALKTLKDQQPFHSLSLLYAAFTGFFLFASGIIAGYVENSVVYGKVAERMRSGVGLRNFKESWRNRIINYVENNFGSLVGNIALGFFLGMASFIGNAFGLPFDIRHITIAAANTSIAYFTMHNKIPLSTLMYTLSGVGLIGLVNFAVSFGLSFLVALKSRGIALSKYPSFFKATLKYVKKYPLDFVRAPLKPRLAEQL
jgi:site-specific recombinase